MSDVGDRAFSPAGRAGRLVGAVALGVVALAACGGSGSTTGAPPTGAPSPTAAVSVAPPPSEPLTSAATSTPIKPGKPTDAITSWWTGDGSAVNSFGSGDGTPTNGAGFAPGIIGEAFAFDGQDDYVALPDSVVTYPTNDAFTFETWFSTTGGGVIFGQNGLPPFEAVGGNNGAIPAVYVGTDGRLYAQMYWSGSVNPLVTGDDVNDGRFHHVAVAFDGTVERLYLDGSLIDERQIQQAGYGPGVYFYQLGTGNTGTQWPAAPTDTGGWYSFDGLIDEAALYVRALSDAEVRAIYDGGVNLLPGS